MGRSRTLPGSVIVERQLQEGLLERALLEREDLLLIDSLLRRGL
jgi:hypothetical protein